MTTEPKFDAQKVADDIEYVRSALNDIHTEAGDAALDEDQQARWDEGKAYIAEQELVLERHNELATIAASPQVVRGIPQFNVQPGITADPNEALRFDATDLEVRDAGMRSLEAATGVTDEVRTAAERTARSVV